MSAIVLRPADLHDADAITELFLAARARMTYLPNLHTALETRAWIANRMLVDDIVTVAVADGKVAGFSAISGQVLDHLYIVPQHQGRGIGADLLGAAQAASPRGLRLHVFQANSGARRFYERHGFRLISLGDGTGNEEGVPDCLYAWSDHGRID